MLLAAVSMASLAKVSVALELRSVMFKASLVLLVVSVPLDDRQEMKMFWFPEASAWVSGRVHVMFCVSTVAHLVLLSAETILL